MAVAHPSDAAPRAGWPAEIGKVICQASNLQAQKRGVGLFFRQFPNWLIGGGRAWATIAPRSALYSRLRALNGREKGEFS